jgi:hypothetical protein
VFPAPLFAVLAAFAHDPSHDPAHPHPHVHAEDEASWEPAPRSEEPVFVGSGRHRYRWDADWMKLPEGRDWLGSTHGCIVVDSGDRVYLSADRGPAILVFAPDGTLLRTLGDDWGSGVHGLALVQRLGADGAPEERLLAVHSARQEVIELDLEGRVHRRIGLPAESGRYEDPGRYRPTSVALAPDGRLFVADGYGLSWIHRFGPDGAYELSFGGPGEGPEHLRTPHGLWMETAGETPVLLVADRENHRIARFSLEGRFLGATDPASGLLRRPCHIQRQGELYVVADLAGRTTLLDGDLELVAHLGDNPDAAQRARYDVEPRDWREGAFCAPHCARENSKGELFVMDWNVAGRVTRLVPAPEPEAPVGDGAREEPSAER